MRILRTIGGIVLIVVSVVFFVAAVGGIVGIWTYVDETVRTTLNTVFDPVQSLVVEAEDLAVTADDSLSDVRESLAAVDARLASETLDSGEEQSVASGVLEEIRDVLQPRIERAQESADTIEQPAQKIEALVESLDTLPLVSLPEPVSEKLAQVSESAIQMRALGQNLEAIPMGAGKGATAVAKLTVGVSKIDTSLGDIETGISDFKTWLGSVETRATNLKSEIWGVAHLSMVGMSVVLAWLAVCQVGMILHGLRLLRN